MYRSITASNNKTIYLSMNHLIYSRKSHAEIFNPKWVDLTDFSTDFSETFEQNKGIDNSSSITLYYWLMNGYISFFRYADYISVGDEVLALQENHELTPAKVINTSTFKMQGTFHYCNILLLAAVSFLLFTTQ